MKLGKKILCMLLVALLVAGCLPLAASAVPISDVEISSRADRLAQILDQRYFNEHQSTECGRKSSGHGCSHCDTANIFKAQWFKNAFGTVKTSQVVSTGRSCVGFAWFACWYLVRASNSDTVRRDSFGYVSPTQSAIYANARIGDYLYVNGNHAMVYLGCNSNGVQVIDCNSRGSYNSLVTRRTVAYSALQKVYISRVYSTTLGRRTYPITSDPVPVDPTLQQGSKGAKVREMQQLLKNAGEILDVDGDFGPKTKVAVISFQKKHGLSPDGICGPNTWATLRAQGGKTSQPSVSVDGQNISVSWSYSGAGTYFDVYLIQEPWGWYDIKYHIQTSSRSCTFTGVNPGYYQAFTIARPNADNVQSVWTPFTVKAPHTSHTWNNGVVTKPATEEEEGTKTFTCWVCGVTKTETIERKPHLEHKWDEGVVVKKPTKIEPGLKVYTCTSSVCNETKEEEIPQLNSDVPFDPTPENDFVDVPNGAYFAKAVNWAVDNGVTEGTSRTTFSPNRVCTRAQAVTFLWRSMGSPRPKASSSKFADVAPGQYYTNAVLWAVENGITGGVSGTKFAPDSKCTRAQIVTFLWRMKGSPAVSGVSPFLDVPPTLYYASSVAWAVENGITEGTSANYFSPHNDCSRGQIVTFLYRGK